MVVGVPHLFCNIGSSQITYYCHGAMEKLKLAVGMLSSPKIPSNPNILSLNRGKLLFLIFLFASVFGYGQIVTVNFTQANYADTEANGGNLPQLVVSGGQLATDRSVTVNDLGTGTAINGTDYTFNGPIVVTIPAGNYTPAVTLPIPGLSITDDLDFESDETIELLLSNATLNVDVGTQGTTTYTITNDDQQSISITDVALAEGSSGGTDFIFTVGVDGGTNAISQINFEVNTSDGTAQSGADYVAIAGGSGSIAAGAASTTITVTVNGDVLVEPDETFNVVLSNPTNARINDGNGLGTILNDDTVTVAFSQSTGAAAENVGNNLPVLLISGTVTNTSTVTLINAGTGTATAGTDFTFSSPQLVNIPAGTYNGTLATAIPVPTLSIIGDAIVEPNETIILSLGGATGDASIGGPSTTIYTITNDDAAAVSLANASGNEDDGPIQLSATLDNAVQGGFSVQVSTNDGTATTADLDYTPINNLTLNFVGSAGETNTFALYPTVDARIEGNETVNVAMSNISGTTLGINISDTAVVTINNDDSCAAVTSPFLNGVETEFCVDQLANFSQNLNEYVDTVAPADTQLRWSTNPDISNTAFYLGSSIVTQAGTYYGFFYDALNNCTSPGSVTVTLAVSEEPDAGTTNNFAICSNSGDGNTVVDLDDRITGQDSGSWVLSSAQPGATISINGNNTVNFDGQPLGPYTFTYITDNAAPPCVNQSVQLTITVIDCTLPCNAGNSAPILDTAQSLDFCDEVNVDLNVYVTSTAPAGSVLTWSVDPDPLETDAHLISSVVLDPGTYYGFYYDSANDCASPVLPVTLVRNFTPVINGTTDATRCGTGVLTLSASATVADVSTITYNWYDAPSGGNLVGRGANFVTPTLTQTTSFFVEARANGCASPRVEVVATVNDAPTVGIPTNAVACNVVGNGGPNTIDLDGTLAGADAGTWAIVSDPSSGALIIGTGNVVDFAGLPGGSYVFEYTTSNAVAPCTNATVLVTISVSDCSVDTDNDGLTDQEENDLGTSPTNPDTDGDGLTDGEEVLVIDNPNTPLIPEMASDPLDPCDPFLTVDCDPQPIDLAITKVVQGTGPFLVGDQVVFVITVTNNDMARVLDIVITDVLNASFQYVDHQASLGAYDPNTGEWTIPEMTVSDAEATLEITANILSIDNLNNTATWISSLPTDNVISNNTSTVILNEDVDLAITKAVDDDNVLLNSEVTFTITVENLAEDRTIDIVVNDLLDRNVFEYISDEPSTGSYNDLTGAWIIDSLEGGQSAALNIRVRVIAIGMHQNTATIASSFPNDGNASNNSDAVSVNVYPSPCVDPGTICNIFTPNGDGINDNLKLVDHQLYTNNSLEVFDRYGNSVFQMDGYDSSWDGTGKNGELPKGTYFYILDLYGDGTEVVKGWIQIIRD